MLALARMSHLTKASTIGTNPNLSTSNDEHTSSIINTEKMFLLNANITQEPTTPCVLNTPNTCTKNSTFFYEIPSTMHTSTLTGKFFFFFSSFSGSLLFGKLRRRRKKDLKILLIFTYINSYFCFSSSLFTVSFYFNIRRQKYVRISILIGYLN
jgi:hypothetical protein